VLQPLESWKVDKKEDKEYVATGLSFPAWVQTPELSLSLLKNDAAEDQLFEFQGCKIFFDKQEAKRYTFHDISHVHACKFPQRANGCEGRLLFNTLEAELRTLLEGLLAALEALSNFVEAEGHIYLESARNTALLMHHLLREVKVKRRQRHG
jgi:hypothetical protein